MPDPQKIDNLVTPAESECIGAIDLTLKYLQDNLDFLNAAINSIRQFIPQLASDIRSTIAGIQAAKKNLQVVSDTDLRKTIGKILNLVDKINSLEQNNRFAFSHFLELLTNASEKLLAIIGERAASQRATSTDSQKKANPEVNLNDWANYLEEFKSGISKYFREPLPDIDIRNGQHTFKVDVEFLALITFITGKNTKSAKVIFNNMQKKSDFQYRESKNYLMVIAKEIQKALLKINGLVQHSELASLNAKLQLFLEFVKRASSREQ